MKDSLEEARLLSLQMWGKCPLKIVRVACRGLLHPVGKVQFLIRFSRREAPEKLLGELQRFVHQMAVVQLYTVSVSGAEEDHEAEVLGWSLLPHHEIDHHVGLAEKQN